MTQGLTSKLRPLLVLARASNLPTVWSNCLAAWWLGGGGDALHLGVVCLGASLLYAGGMFLNDAFDAEFDRQYRCERPIPSGAVSERTVWLAGTLLLFAGALCLAWFGLASAILATLLIGCILLYDAVHKRTMLSPVIMAGCRVFLYLVAASAALDGINGLTVWSAVALGCYIIGLSYIAKAESAPGPLRYWPCLFLAVPLLLAWLVNDGPYSKSAWICSLLLVLWTGWSLRNLFGKQINVGAGVSGLLAGIVLVDLLAVAPVTWPIFILFVILFVSARTFQKFIPAT